MLSSRRYLTFAWQVGFTFACALACVYGCESRPKPQREWRAEDHTQPAELDPARMPPDTQAGQAPEEEAGGVGRAAAALWNVSCAGCHGRDGNGQGAARPPGVQPPDFSSADFQKSRTDAQLAAAIVEGRNMMPPFGKQVNEQGVRALVAHVRSLGPAVPASPASPGSQAPTP